MSKNLIDHIIADKLNEINFEFKPAYWNKMQEKLEANCSQTNTCVSNTINGFLCTSLITVFISVIGIILYAPWPINNDVANVQNTIYVDTLIEKEIPIISSINMDSDYKIQEEAIAETKEIEIKDTKAVIKTRKKAKKQKVKSIKTLNKKSRVEKEVNPKPITEPMAQEASPSIDSIALDSSNHSNTFDRLDSKQKEEPLFENDSIYIPDSKITEDDQEEVKEEIQLDVQAELEPVKNVKTRTKPVKRVFKKRKGILYRMGLRR